MKSILQTKFPHTLENINQAIATKHVDEQGFISNKLSLFKAHLAKETDQQEKENLQLAVSELLQMLKASVQKDIKQYLGTNTAHTKH